MFKKVEIFKYLCLILCLPPAEKSCFRPQLQENFYAGSWFSVSFLISIYHPQYYTFCHRTNSLMKHLIIQHKTGVKGESYLRDFPHQVTSFRSLHWHHRSHESPIFITIFASTGMDPPQKKALNAAEKDAATHLLPEKPFGKSPPLSRVAYFWRTCGSSCGCYWVLLNKSSTSASALITAQLWPARPLGCVCVCVYGGVYVNYPTLVAAAAEMCVCFCAFSSVCLLGYQALVGAVAMVFLHTARPGWLKALVEFWKTSRGMTAGGGRTKVVLVSVTWQASESGESSGAKKWP